MHIRTPAVQHKKLTKKNFFFVYITMGVHMKENLSFVKNILRGIISGSTQEKIE